MTWGMADFWREEQPTNTLFPEPVKDYFYTLDSEHHNLYVMRTRMSKLKREEKQDGDGGESLF